VTIYNDWEAPLKKSYCSLPDGRVELRFWDDFLSSLSESTVSWLFSKAKCKACGEALASENVTSCDGHLRNHEKTGSEWYGSFSGQEWQFLDSMLLADYKRIRRTIGEKRRKLAMNNAPGAYHKNDVDKVFNIQEGLCCYCNNPVELSCCHIDHMYPISKGGSLWPSNLAISCANCNLEKNALTAEEYLKKLKKKRGADWHGAQQSRIASQQQKKEKIDISRKRAIKKKLASVKDKIQKLLPTGSPFEIEVKDQGLLLRYAGAMILMPPSSHRKMWKYNDAECCNLVLALNFLVEPFRELL
jgi:5-methylcytosine-specific restriction endonuclease McrA